MTRLISKVNKSWKPSHQSHDHHTFILSLRRLIKTQCRGISTVLSLRASLRSELGSCSNSMHFNFPITRDPTWLPQQMVTITAVLNSLQLYGSQRLLYHLHREYSHLHPLILLPLRLWPAPLTPRSHLIPLILWHCQPSLVHILSTTFQ